MSERTCRGYMIQSTTNYIDRNYDEETRKRIYERVSPRVRDLTAKVNKIEWYPVEDAAELLKAIAVHHEESDGQFILALEHVGRSIAETATNTFLKLLLRFLTPALFVSKAPDFWARDNRCGALVIDSYEADKRFVKTSLRGVGGYDYIGPVVPGFLLFALETVGCTKPRVKFDFDSKNPGPDNFTYEFTWDE